MGDSRNQGKPRKGAGFDQGCEEGIKLTCGGGLDLAWRRRAHENWKRADSVGEVDQYGFTGFYREKMGVRESGSWRMLLENPTVFFGCFILQCFLVVS